MAELMNESQTIETDSDNHFINFTHVARFRVNRILTENKQQKKQNEERKTDDVTAETYHLASGDFNIHHNGESILFKAFIKWCHHNELDSPNPLEGICPGLCMFQSTIDKVETTDIVVQVVCKSSETTICESTGYLLFHGCPTHFTIHHPSARNGRCLPRAADLLSEEGYLIDNGITLAIKYKLKLHRSVFDCRGNYAVPLVSLTSPEPSDFDRFEFEELKRMRAKDGNRFVLESSDGARYCAHKNRLVFASEYFKKLFRENPQDREMKMDISAECLKQILAFIYLGNIFDETLNESIVVELAKAADKYLLNTLKTICQSRLLSLASRSIVTLSQIIGYIWLAYETNLPQLKKMCMDWLRDHWDAVKDEDEVKELMNDEEGKKIMLEFVEYLTRKS